MSDCDFVTVRSVSFDIETGYDFLMVTDRMYTGTEIINQIVPPNFTVSFTSDESETRSGFVLHWYCTTAQFTWTEWTQAEDGSCNEHSKLADNGTAVVVTFGLDVENPDRYRESNGSCGKHNFY